MLCKYSKFQIELNSYFSIRFETSTIIQNFRIFTDTDIINGMTPIFHLSNQQTLLLTMVQVLYLLEIFTLAHYPIIMALQVLKLLQQKPQ